MKTAATTPPAAESALTPYTPLPWMIFSNENGDYVIQAEYGPHGEVATITPQYPQDDGQRSERAEAANARFILAACTAHAAAQQRIVDLEKALQPFADCEPLVTSMGNVPDDQLFLWKPSQTSKELPGISVAHIKQARLALRRPERT